MSYPDAPRVLVCGRRGDPNLKAEPGSIVERCCDCGHEVLAGPQTVVDHAVSGAPIVCLNCWARERRSRPMDNRFRDGGAVPPPEGEG